MKTFCGFVFGCVLFNLVNSEGMRIINQTKNDLGLIFYYSYFGSDFLLLGKNEVTISHVQLFRYFPILITQMAVKDTFFMNAALYNQMGLAKQEFQPVEIWVTNVAMHDILERVNEANRICPDTVTTVMYIISRESQLNNTKFSDLKIQATANNLKLGVYLHMSSSDPCVYLKTLPLKYIDQVYVTMISVQLREREFENCKFEIKNYYEAENTILGFVLQVKGLIAFNNVSFDFEFEHGDNLTWEYFQNLSHIFHSPLIISNDLVAVKNETEYGNICYNTNDVYEWVSDETVFSNHSQAAEIMLPFDFESLNIANDILTTVLWATPKIWIYNIHSLDGQSGYEIDLFFKTLQSAIFDLNKTHGANFTKTINATVLLIAYENDTFNEAYAQALRKVGETTNQWNAQLNVLVREVSMAALSLLGQDKLGEFLKNNAVQKWINRLGIFVNTTNCQTEFSTKTDFVILRYSVKIPRHCQTLVQYETLLSSENKRCKDSILAWNSSGIEVISSLNVLGCNAKIDSIYKLREYGTVMQAWTNMLNVQHTRFLLHGPDAHDFGSESEQEYGKCMDWMISKEESYPATNQTRFVLETRQQVARKMLNKSFPGFFLKTSTTNRPKQPKRTTESSYSLWWLSLPCVLGVFVVGFLLAVTLLRCYLHRQLKNVDVAGFFIGKKLSNHERNDGMDLADSCNYQKEKFEKPISSFTIDKTCCLGTGEYGEVYKSILKEADKETCVAVKTVLKTYRFLSSKNILHLKSLMTEIKVLAYVGDHNHIVKLCGANTSQLRRGRLFVFLEYCENGSLEKYLREIKPVESCNEPSPGSEMNDSYENLSGSHKLDPDVLELLAKWSLCIARGMEYLATKKIVHADLAARNILLDRDFNVKISDFGLSRRLYNYTNYVKSNNQEPLPWRWMALEALKRMEFNEKTDVWSFGVLLWEIYTLGDTPYPGLSWSVGFTKQLEDGLRLGSPKYGNEKEVYTVMLNCWAIQPERRPCFSELVQMFLH